MAQAAGEAYQQQPQAVTVALANAIKDANANATWAKSAAQAVAYALTNGTTAQQDAFAAALAYAVNSSGCGAVNNVLSRKSLPEILLKCAVLHLNGILSIIWDCAVQYAVTCQFCGSIHITYAIHATHINCNMLPVCVI